MHQGWAMLTIWMESRLESRTVFIYKLQFPESVENSIEGITMVADKDATRESKAWQEKHTL